MGIEDFDQLSRSMPNQSTCHALSNIPIASPKRSGPTIQWISPHGRTFNWPFTQNRQTTAQYTREIEFGVGEDMRGFIGEIFKVRVYPYLLEGDNVVS
jgi:hypothetical protein